MTTEDMGPPSSPTRQRKQIIQPWWILAFAFLQTLVFVYLSVGLPSAPNEIRRSSSVGRQKQQSQSPVLKDEEPSIQRNVRSLEVDRAIIDPRLQRLERRVKKRLNASLVTACQRTIQVNDKNITEDVCQESNKPIVAYNSASYPRIWCGSTVPSGGFVLLTKSSCLQEPPRVFPIDPTVEGNGMPPIHVEPYMPHIFLRSFQNKKRDVADIECNIPCRKTVGGDVFSGTDYRIVGTDLKILHSLESSQYYRNLRVKPDAYLENQYYSTTSLRSEIPVTYFSFSLEQKPAVRYEDAIRGASFIAQNCDSRNNREAVVKELMNYTRVDSLSSCLHNAEPPNGLSLEGGQEGKKKLMRAYLFHLAFENSNEDDYVTEKLWGTLESGTLPVYLGAPNVKEHAPPHSIISWHDFNSTKELALYMNKVAANKSLYESYHEWRRKPLPETLKRKFEFTHTHSICRMCRWAYAKKYGLGWSHESQTVQDLVLSRRVRYDANGKVIHPFREVSELPADSWSRTVWEHDGVIDLHFEANETADEAKYRIETAVKGSFRTVESNNFVLQNDTSRVTILTSWDAKVENPEPGTIEATLKPSVLMLRIRVLVEDVDRFHQGADKVTNYFGDFMTKDFFTPMKTFQVVGGNLTSLATS